MEAMGARAAEVLASPRRADATSFSRGLASASSLSRCPWPAGERRGLIELHILLDAEGVLLLEGREVAEGHLGAGRAVESDGRRPGPDRCIPWGLKRVCEGWLGISARPLRAREGLI